VAVEPPPPRLLRRRPAIEIQLQRRKLQNVRPPRKQQSTRNEKRNGFADAGAKKWAHQLQRGPADVLLRRPRVLPAVEDVAAHHRARSTRSASCRFSPTPAPAVTAAAPPTRSCPRRAPPIRGARPLGSRQTRRFAGRTPSCASPAATGLPSGSPPHRRAAPADRFGALWIGWSRRGRLDWIGPNPTGAYVWLSLFLLFYFFSSRAGCRRAGAVRYGVEKVRGSRRRTHWYPEGGGLGLLEEKKKVVTAPTGHARMNGYY
jgi:hypothetical protein